MDFLKSTMEEKEKIINEVVDEKIRYMLQMDGGDLNVIGFREVEGVFEVNIKYLGACGGCAFSEMGTLGMIERILKEELVENIKVVTVK